MTHDDARRQFPHTWSNIVYLNHAAVSPMSFRVRDAVDRYQTRRALKGIEPYPWAIKMAMETKSLIAQLLNCEAGDIAFVLNTGDGLNILAQGLDWKPGDHLLLNDLEFPSNVYPFLNLKQKGVEVERMTTSGGAVTAEDIEKHLRKETRLVSLSQVQYGTGYKADLVKIGKLLRGKNILFAVDAIQGIPHTPIDVRAANIDFLSSGSHKWLMAPEGTGFIYANERAREAITQAYLGWTSVEDAFNFNDLDPARLRKDSGRYENGMLNFPGIAGLKASLEFFFEFGIPEMERRVLDMTGYLVDRLSSKGLNVVTSPEESERSGIVSFEIENVEEVYKRMMEKEIIISLRNGRLRISPHFYNTDEEVRKCYISLFD